MINLGWNNSDKLIIWVRIGGLKVRDSELYIEFRSEISVPQEIKKILRIIR